MFDDLLQRLDELKELSKSMTTDDDMTPGAAAVNQDEKDEVSDLLSKSMTMIDENGDEIEAIDGTELVKSLVARIDHQDELFTAQKDELATQNEALTKSLNSMLEVLSGQSEMIKSLNAKIETLQDSGRGRKSVVSILEKPDAETLTKSDPAGVSNEEFMAKAMAAQASGRLTSLDISIAEASINKGVAIPASIVNRVL